MGFRYNKLETLNEKFPNKYILTKLYYKYIKR